MTWFYGDNSRRFWDCINWWECRVWPIWLLLYSVGVRLQGLEYKIRNYKR